MVREAVPGTPTGFLRVVDLDAGRVVYCCYPPESLYGRDDPNPRGGTRGTKGVSAWGDHLAVAVAERITIFDRSWRRLRDVTHPWFGQLHGILAGPDGIWVTCTACDMLVRLSWEGKCVDSWSWRSDPELPRSLGLGRPPAFDRERDYRDPLATGGGFDSVHLNAVTRGGNGLLVNFGQVRAARTVRRHRYERFLIGPLERLPSTRPLLRWVRRRRLARPIDHGPDGRPLPLHSFALIELSDRASGADGDRRFARILHRRGGVGYPNHDVVDTGERIVYNDTNANQVVALDREGNELDRVSLPGEPGFARGLAWLGGDRFLAGNQAPASVHTVDMAAGRLVSSLALEGPTKESVSSIAVLPDRFTAPPSELQGFTTYASPQTTA